MTKEDFYHDFLLIRKMRVPINKRYRILSELLGCYENAWRVTGVTYNALKVFSDLHFRRESGMGINRSHIVDRKSTYVTMLEGPLMECDEWWNFYLDNDKTILATSAENMSNGFSEIFDVDSTLGLFKPQGFAWRHKDPEINFLKETYELTQSKS